jgi:hypothetical protein
MVPACTHRIIARDRGYIITNFWTPLFLSSLPFHLYLCKEIVVRFEVFTAVTMKNGVFWDVTLCGSCKNRRFRGT